MGFRIVMILSIGLLASTASASWMQEYCSDAEGIVSLRAGHNDNYLSFTTESGKHHFEDGYLVKDLRTVKLRSRSGGNCNGSWAERVAYRKVKFTKDNGEAFPADIPGLSKDGKSVTADLLCIEKIASEAYCPDNNE